MSMCIFATDASSSPYFHWLNKTIEAMFMAGQKSGCPLVQHQITFIVSNEEEEVTQAYNAIKSWNMNKTCIMIMGLICLFRQFLQWTVANERRSCIFPVLSQGLEELFDRFLALSMPFLRNIVLLAVVTLLRTWNSTWFGRFSIPSAATGCASLRKGRAGLDASTDALLEFVLVGFGHGRNR